MRITNKQAYDILTTAIEGGFGSWWTFDEIERDEELNITFATARCPDYDEDPVTYTFNEAIIRRGWDLLVNEYGTHQSYIGDEVRTGLQDIREDKEMGTPGVMDAIGCEAVLQMAAFGELVFG